MAATKQKTGADINKESKRTTKSPQQPKPLAKKKVAKPPQRPPSDPKSIVLGEMTQAFVTEIQQLTLPGEKRPVWDSLPESTQKNIIERQTKRARDAIENLVTTLASEDHPHIQVLIGKGDVKPAGPRSGAVYETKVQFPLADPLRETMIDRTGKNAILLLIDPDDYQQEGDNMPRSTPDQPDLPGT